MMTTMKSNHALHIKRIPGYALPVLLILAAGCGKGFLDVPPQGQQPAQEFWVSQEDATKAVSAMYANLHEWRQVGFAALAVEDLGSDETEKGSDPNDASFLGNFDNFTYTASDGQVTDFWKGQYQEVNFCNQVLDNVPNIKMEDGLKNRYLAEAKFIRAYAYFRLVRAFGDVPLRLHVPKGTEEYNIPRTSKTEVWAAIEKDLTEAAAVLPTSYSAAEAGRATKGAALALHAKAAMYQKKWADVLTYTNQVMALGYSLFPDYEKLFRIPNENSVESVFELQCQTIPGNKDASNSQYSQIQGVKNQPGGGWGFNTPTQTLVDAYETGDPRKNGTILFRGTKTVEGDSIRNVGVNRRFNYKSYVPFTLWQSGYNEGADQNVRVIRYAEVLLMNAEAANETGNSGLALSSLNAVRARARGGNNNVLPNVTTTNQAQLRLAIYHERRIELAMERDRFFDVIRQGRGAEVFGPMGFKAGKNELMPIPQTERDLSNNLLTQNPGY
ncbi:Starch-binding associating with outer membrane [Chitinophaga eiseniae]|uniref:Starch-binding associating with outer membrane n=2 Tax=Chitinophaga eiseniae TaxID=634771 RepID=A0A1T4M727_9BACT|nr:Starch-binding associating with outer membrane [Chitinophaga eiseniae]